MGASFTVSLSSRLVCKIPVFLFDQLINRMGVFEGSIHDMEVVVQRGLLFYDLEERGLYG